MLAISPGVVSMTLMSGAIASWGSTPITASGGQYRLCWCASGFLDGYETSPDPNITAGFEEELSGSKVDVEHDGWPSH